MNRVWLSLIAVSFGIFSVGADGHGGPPGGRALPALQQRIDAAPRGVVEIAAGEYLLDAPLVITNGCSLKLHKNAILRAGRAMDAVVRVDSSACRPRDLGVFFTGGVIDGNGIASCMTIDGFRHPTMRDMVFRNGKDFGLWVGGAGKGGCELVAENLYFQCSKRGLAGNAALRLDISDCHFTDIVIVDWTVGVDLRSGGANRFTRCHVWGGTIRPRKAGEVCEMVENSTCFRIGEQCCGNVFRDCYADTGKIGFDCAGWETAFYGCSYYNNHEWTNLDDVTIVRQTAGTILFDGGFFHKSCPKLKVYEGTGRIRWSNILYSRFERGDDRPGAVDFGAGIRGSDAGLNGRPVRQN